MADPSPLQEALAAGLQPGNPLWMTLGDFGEYEITTEADAQAVCDAMKHVGLPGAAADDEDSLLAPGTVLLRLLQQVRGKGAGNVVRREVMPMIIRATETAIAAHAPNAAAAAAAEPHTLLLMLKLLALYAMPQSVDLIAAATRNAVAPDSFMWPGVLAMFSPANPRTAEMLRRLSDPLPSGMCAIALLDAANALAIKAGFRPHPFDHGAGYRRLEAWLRDVDPENFSFARSATTSLPFLAPGAREPLLALALAHPDPAVRLEAGWASAKLGDEAGVELLARFAADAKHAARAKRYLEEVGRADAVPPAVADPEFAARAEMLNWLADPSEFGRAPDAIELYDTRVIAWPPTNDRRRVWLFKYAYRGAGEGGADEAGLGMVGSITFSLFGEATADLAPEDAYALHCCWELQANKDPRAPQERGVAEGRRILAEHA